MNIAIASYSGSVGKTIAAAHLFAPHMPGVAVFAIESTNESARDLGLDAEMMKGARFNQLARQLLAIDNAIIDIGASNIEDFLAYMVKYEDGHRLIDLWVLPVVATGKAQRETIRTVTALLGIGVAPQHIRLLFNRVDGDIEEDFSAIMGFAEQGTCIADARARIDESQVFELLANRRTTIADVLADTTDYRALIRVADRSDTDALDELIDKHELQSLCKPVGRQLRESFDVLVAAYE